MRPCVSKCGDRLTPSFEHAWFVAPLHAVDGDILGPFFLIEDALKFGGASMAVVYKKATVTPFELRRLENAKKTGPSSYVINAGLKARWRTSKLIAYGRLVGSVVFANVLLAVGR